MADFADTPELFASPLPPTGTILINDRCLIRTRDRHRIVVVAGVPLAHYTVGDRMAEAYAMVCLVEQGWADQNDVAQALGYSRRTLHRYQLRFEEGGLPALGRPGGYPKGRPRLPPSRLSRLRELKSRGLSNCEIARRLCVTETSIRKLLKRLGLGKVEVLPPQLPFPPEASNPKLSPFSGAGPVGDADAGLAGADPKLSPFSTDEIPVSLDTDPMDRRRDRLFAFLGLLDDAAPLFESKEGVPHAGLLLAIPAILQSGVLDCARTIYSSIGPAFFGLRTSIVTLLLMALLRIKRPEGLKERVPQDLGRVLGLDRAPEVKTLRRKLARLGSFGRATDFGRILARHRVARRGVALGFLYVDGHVRVYHGEKTLPKAHVTRMRIALPATTDYWVNDRDGEPLFVVTAEANQGLCQMLPQILAEIRPLVGDRRVTVVFDRGGWSPILFQKLITDGFHFMTYRKGRSRKVARSCFRKHVTRVEGRRVHYHLADQRIRLLKGALRLRQVTRLSKDGHQTPIVTSRRDLSAARVAYRMFNRWRQENFFKYLREEYALDALADYASEPADPDRDVPNPARRDLDEAIRAARAALHRAAAELGGQALLNEEARRPTMRGFKIAHAGMSNQVKGALERLMRLRARRAKLPPRIPVKQITQGAVVKLATERKHLTNLLKMVAYQVESDLVQMIRPGYSRADQEGRTLVQSMLASAADLAVTKTELRVTLAPLSSSHKTRVLQRLCEDLDQTNTAFPGTRLRLRFAVHFGPKGQKGDTSG
jgi:hypothetical protein